MKTFFHFVGFSLAVGLTVVLLAAAGCSGRDVDDSPETPPDSQVVVAQDYRLTEDRQAMEELRKQVPPQKKVANDELAFLLKLFENPNDTTSRIRDRYNMLIRNKRREFDSDLQTKRKTFNATEKSDRETYASEHQRILKSLRGRKMSSESKRKKVTDEEDKRKVFYQEQRLKRETFEAGIKAERANFEDYLRQKNSEFNQEMRNYEAQQRELKKQQDLQKKSQQENQLGQ